MKFGFSIENLIKLSFCISAQSFEVSFVDIVLERILSLIPRKENGAFVHGAKKDFAKSIGYDSGDIVSMWIKGTSSSYMGKIHEISNIYNVSIEYLKGETDIKEKVTANGDDLSDKEMELLKVFRSLTDEEQELFLKMFSSSQK